MFCLKLFCRAAFALLLLVAGQAMAVERIPPAAREGIERGEVVDLLVRISEDASLLSQTQRRTLTGSHQLRGAIKDRLENAVLGGDLERLKRYEQLPMMAVRVRSADALQRLAARGEVLEIYENVLLYPILSQSLPLIGQPAAALAGQQGNGTAIAILDTGVDYTKSEFGGCTAPGTPSTCKVAYALDTAPDDAALDSIGHGSMVAAIASSVAPQAKIIALDVFDGSSASSIDVVEAINWVITNRATYNIVSINMSLGGSTKYTATCPSVGGSNPFQVAIQQARAAGIMSFIASGNSAFSDGLAMPACTPEAVSVGAVYDANVGGLAWSGCTDSTTAADQVACFSNSASFLNLLAPGALITTSWSSGGGTSFAAPHVAGAYAVLRGARPTESATASLVRFTTYGKSVTDSRNGLVKPRIDLANALQFPSNDAFAAAISLSGSSGSASGSNVIASAETGEPAHAGASPVRSVWWKWVAPAGGDAAFNTTGSGFDTVLAAYTGSTVNTLTLVAQNDNQSGSLTTSKITFRAVAGTTYYLAVAGSAGTTGAISLAWSLTEPVADLAVSLLATPDPAVAGNDVTYTATVTNNGPYTAESVLLTFAVPQDATLRSASSGCIVATGSVSCSLGNMTLGQTLTRQVVLLAASAGNLTVSASADATWGDPVAGNDTASDSVVVAAATKNDGDVPLPAWSLGLLALGLWRGLATRKQR